jgi:hypothetical protein
MNGALAGALAAGVWAIQQPIDKRVFGSDYDDVELLGKLMTNGPEWPAVGTLIHLANGAIFGAVYASLRPLSPAPPPVTGLGAGMAEHVGLWPLARFVDAYHPARSELVEIGGNRRAFAQATWRHALFGVVLGVLEARLNSRLHEEPPAEVQASSNGHGDIEAVVTVTSAD